MLGQLVAIRDPEKLLTPRATPFSFASSFVRMRCFREVLRLPRQRGQFLGWGGGGRVGRKRRCKKAEPSKGTMLSSWAPGGARNAAAPRASREKRQQTLLSPKFLASGLQKVLADRSLVSRGGVQRSTARQDSIPSGDLEPEQSLKVSTTCARSAEIQLYSCSGIRAG